ncbi:MAG: hypothetical protein NT166_09095 [Candidatus Aminicenantes bacterium]|nr:hypothetical protein [Candidatus Aminicenantes bacterium]
MLFSDLLIFFSSSLLSFHLRAFVAIFIAIGRYVVPLSGEYSNRTFSISTALPFNQRMVKCFPGGTISTPLGEVN